MYLDKEGLQTCVRGCVRACSEVLEVCALHDRMCCVETPRMLPPKIVSLTDRLSAIECGRVCVCVCCRCCLERAVPVVAVCLLLLRLQVGAGGHQASQQAALL